MGTFLKVFGGVSLLVIALTACVMLLPHAASGYSPSNDVLNASEVSKNPYKFKGTSGIMNPGMLRFSNMAGDHTAIYSMAFIENDDQLAVTMDNNDPPSTGRWWRVYVDGTMDATNGFGAPITIAEIKFEGFADPSPEATPTPLPVEPQVQTEPAQAPTIEPEQKSPDETQPPAPIVRQPPSPQ